MKLFRRLTPGKPDA